MSIHMGGSFNYDFTLYPMLSFIIPSLRYNFLL
jgi:hypothetical protein